MVRDQAVGELVHLVMIAMIRPARWLNGWLQKPSDHSLIPGTLIKVEGGNQLTQLSSDPQTLVSDPQHLTRANITVALRCVHLC